MNNEFKSINPSRSDFYYTIGNDNQARIQYYDALQTKWIHRYKKEAPKLWREMKSDENSS